MWLKKNYKKFIKHFKKGRLLYAFQRHLKNFIFLIKKQRNRFKYLNPLLQHGSSLLKVSEKSNGILFIQCPPWGIDMPPLGLAYLSNYLRKYGFNIFVYDLNNSLYNLTNENYKYLWELRGYNYWVDDELFQDTWTQVEKTSTICLGGILKKINAEYICLSVNFSGIHFVSELLKIIKKLNNKTKIILGGWGCVNEHMRSLFPKELIDVFVVGEGEETLREVIEALRGHRNKRDILGAIFNKDPQSVYKPRPPIIKIDNIPWPTFHEFDLNQYKVRALPILTSRGCIGNCSFCNDWYLTRPYRFRHAENIFKEIKYHVENNLIDTFSFKDLACNGNTGELNLLCDLIIKDGLRIHWDSNAISHRRMSYELLCKLKKSGCETLSYGVESFSNNVLKKMRKLFTKEIAEKVIRDTYNAGIRVTINIIVGFPGETEDDFNETVEGIKRSHEYISQMCVLSVCLINNDSDLDINPWKYQINLSSDPKIRAKQWTSMDGKNTYEARKKRIETILELIQQLGLSCTQLTT